MPPMAYSSKSSPRPASLSLRSRRSRRRCGCRLRQCLRFERESFGALHQMLSGLAEPGREAAWEEVGAALKQFAGPDGFDAPSRLLVAAGTR